MAEEEVGVLCYWNCPIKHGPDGVYFENSAPPKMMRVKKKTDFSRFLDELYLITGLDKQKSKLELLYRQPLSEWPSKFSHLLYPVENDASLETMLEVPSSHPYIGAVQLYLEVIPTSRDVVAASPLENPRKRRKRTEQEVVDTNSGSDASFNNAGPCLVSGLWLDDDTMRVGLCFKDIGEMKKAVNWWSIKREQKCLVRETGKDMYVFECVRWQCKWSICAARMGKDGLFEVTKCSGPHTCRRGYSPDHELEFLEDEIERVFRVQTTLSTAELVKWWKDKFEYPLDAVADLSQKEEFDSYMKKIKEKNPEAWELLNQIPPQQWALAHDSGRRFGIIKIDSEALFAVCKSFRKVAMAGGLMLLFGELRDAFDESFSRSRGSLSRGDVYIEPVMEKLEELTKGSFTCVVTPLERDAFQVTTKDRILFCVGLSGHTTCGIVQLNDSTCTCGKFQLKKFPCLHALAVCDKLKINPLQYVDDCYTVERYHNTYAATFSPVPKLSAWPEPSGVPTLLPPVIGLLHLEEDEEEDDDDDDDDGGDDDDDDDGDDDDDDEDE